MTAFFSASYAFLFRSKGPGARFPVPSDNYRSKIVNFCSANLFNRSIHESPK